MKKVISFIGIIALIIAGLGVYSCQNETKNDKQSSNEITAKSMEFVGIEHNQLLEESFEFIKKEYKSGMESKSSIDKKQKLEDFLISKIQSNTKYTQKSNDLGVDNLRKIFASNKSSKSSIKEDIILSLDTPQETKEYLEKLNVILDQMDYDNNVDIEKQISELEIKIEKNKNLTTESLITLFSATQTARYSYRYWKENIHKWESLNSNRLSAKTTENLTQKGGKCATCEHFKDIIKHDIGGAVGGAIGAAVVNVVPGWGQAAYGSAIVGGAVGASAAAGVKKLLDWLW